MFRKIIRQYLEFPIAIPVSRVRNLRLTTPSAAVRRRLPPEGFRSQLLARLACLIHAANVHSEPGSNPSYDCLTVPNLPPLVFSPNRLGTVKDRT